LDGIAWIHFLSSFQSLTHRVKFNMSQTMYIHMYILDCNCTCAAWNENRRRNRSIKDFFSELKDMYVTGVQNKQNEYQIIRVTEKERKKNVRQKDRTNERKKDKQTDA
jgi:hypothetical protein